MVEIEQAEAITGGLFARPGDEARVFTFGDAPLAGAGEWISAEVEFIGGPTGGEFQLVHMLGASSSDDLPLP